MPDVITKQKLPYDVLRFLDSVGSQHVMPLTASEARYLYARYEGPNDVERATTIVRELNELAGVQSALKAAFKNDELDGGWKTALEHPLYLQAEARKASLQDELKGLI